MKQASASQQLDADYTESTKEFCIDLRSNPDAKKLFCLGVSMTVLTMQDYANKQFLWPAGSKDLEDAIEKYFRAAQRATTNG